MKNSIKQYCIAMVMILSSFLSYSQERTLDMPQFIRVISFDGFFNNSMAVSREVFLLQFNNGEMRDTTIVDTNEILTIISKLNKLKKQKSLPYTTDQIFHELHYSRKMDKIFPVNKDGDNRMLMLLCSTDICQYVWFSMDGVYIGNSIYHWDEKLKELVSHLCNSFP